MVEKCAECVLNSFKNVPEIFHFGSAKQYISLALQNVTKKLLTQNVILTRNVTTLTTQNVTTF